VGLIFIAQGLARVVEFKNNKRAPGVARRLTNSRATKVIYENKPACERG